MNVISKIIQSFIIGINSLLNKLDHKTADTIKQSYYLIIFILIVIAVALGVLNGKGSAQKTGIQMADETNKIFEIEIKRNRDDVSFGHLLESELIKEKEMISLSKKEFPAKENLVTEKRDHIVEAEKDRKSKFLDPAPINNNMPVGIKRTEEEPAKADVKRIEKKDEKPANEKSKEIIHDKIKPLQKEKAAPSNKESGSKIKSSSGKLPVINRKSEVTE